MKWRTMLSVLLVVLTLAYNSNAQTTLIPASNGGFETGGSLAANGWTGVNNATNTWQVGTAATAFAGSNSVFLSNDGGTTWAYTLTSSQTSHFYRDITVPAGEGKISLTFQWKGNGESGLDRLLIYTAPTTVTPVAGTPASSSTTLTGATLIFTQPSFAQVTYTSATVILPASLAGTTFRLIFTWQNNASAGTSPGASIDDIVLTSAVPADITSNAVSGVWSNAGTWAGGVVPGAGDNVTIADGATVTIDGNYTTGTLTVGQGASGILQYDATARTVTTFGDITIASGATFKSAATGSTSTVTTHALSAGGNLTNNGTLNFSATAGFGGTTVNASAALITFTGSTEATFDCSASASITNLRATTGVTLNKGSSSTTILNFIPTTTYRSAAGATSAGTTITVGSTTGLSVGMYLTVTSGSGAFAVGTTVSSITNATTFVVSAAPSTPLSGGASIITASRFATSSASVITFAGGFLTITNGTFKIGGSNSFLHPYFTTNAYSIPATGGIWLDNSNATISGLGGPAMSGLLKITAGTFNIGSSINNQLSAVATSSFIIEGGTINVAGIFSVSTSSSIFNMSGGTMNICTVGNSTNGLPSFGVSSVPFTMSGGVINLVRASTAPSTPRDYHVGAGEVAEITGGTLNVGTSATLTGSNFILAGATPTMVVDNTTFTKTATLLSNLVTYGDLTINAGSTLNLNTLKLTELGSTLNNSGIFALGSGSLTMISTSGQTISGVGTVTGNLAVLTIQNPAGVTITHSNQIPTLRSNLYQGVVTGAGKITMGTGAASAVVTQIGLAGITTAGGSFDVSPTWDLGTGTYTILYLEETSARISGFEIPPTRIVTNVTIGNANNVTLAGGNLNIGTLTLSGGKFITDAANLVTITGTTTTSTARSSYTSAVSATSSGSTITVSSTNNLVAGMRVSVTLGSGAFAAGTFVTSVVNSTTFTVSAPPTTALTGSRVAGIGGWVSGPLIITLPASLVTGSTYSIPIGKTDYSAFDLVNPTTGAGGTVLIRSEVFEANAGGTPGTNMTSLNTNKYWASSIATGSANFTNSFFKITDVTAGAITATSAIAASGTLTGAYALVGGAPTVVNGSTVTTTAPAATSMAGFYILGTRATVLPVTFLSFSGKRNGDKNLLQWTTAQEQDNKGFDVQRSEDGSSFKSVGFVMSKAVNGSSGVEINYDLSDAGFTGLVHYYRLQQVDLDGRSKMSNTIVIKSGRPLNVILSEAYPNPAHSLLNVRIDAPTKNNVVILIADMKGNIVERQERVIHPGRNSVELAVESFAAGTYLLRVVCGDGCEKASLTFVKQ